MSPSPRSLTLGVVAHVDAGKTSLTERLLFETGASTSLGSVDAGTTRTDSMDLERRRGITIRASVTGFGLGDRIVTLVDTPGHPDFIAEVERSIGVLDAAVLVVSAVEGVQSQTVQIWRALQRAAIPTLIFVNKADRPGADIDAVVRQIGDHLTRSLVVLTRVRGEGTSQASVFDLTPEHVLDRLAAVDEEALELWSREEVPAAADLLWEVTDFRVTMTRSQYQPRQSHAHGTFSKSMSTVANDFRHLAPSVLHTALTRAGTYVCHPVDRFELEVPEAVLPAVLAALGRLGAQVDGSGTAGTRIVLQGTVESARVQPFSRGLADLTSGHGILGTRFERYAADRSDPVPTRRRQGPDPADRLSWFRAHPR